MILTSMGICEKIASIHLILVSLVICSNTYHHQNGVQCMRTKSISACPPRMFQHGLKCLMNVEWEYNNYVYGINDLMCTRLRWVDKGYLALAKTFEENNFYYHITWPRYITCSSIVITKCQYYTVKQNTPFHVVWNMAS